MPTLKSGLKRMRSDKRKNRRNQSIQSDLQTRAKKFDALVSKKGAGDITASLKSLVSKIKKASAKGIIHKNKASRMVSRLTRKANKSRSA